MDYVELISIGNLFQAWSEFRQGKSKKNDVQAFERNLEDNLFNLHYLLNTKTYRHGGYEEFYVNDPKRRHIHKASVSDRIIHHLLYSYLYQLFDKTFIYDSYSCRLDKGTHKGVARLANFARKISQNYTRPCYALKLDIKKFFASIDNKILIGLLEKRVDDKDIIWLLRQIVCSFCSCCQDEMLNSSERTFLCGGGAVQHDNDVEHKGIPLGNLTSQIFANIYLNELDQFVKHELKVKYYIRYADDFVILDSNKDINYKYTDILAAFLKDRLNLELHPKKIILRKLKWGIDFLGYIVLPHYILPRTRTKRRIFRKIQEKICLESLNQSLQSYLGYLGHANSFKITQELENQVLYIRRIYKCSINSYY